MTRDKDDIETLTLGIRNSHRVVNMIALAVVASYVVWFFLVRHQELSLQPEVWGQFGDYIGGLLNPLVAYFAFYWLTRSVSLQKRELAETRVALEESSASQERQARAAHTSFRVAALSSLINSIMGEVQLQRMQIQFILDQAANSPAGAARKMDGSLITARQIPVYLEELNQIISQRMTDRFDHEQELKRLLEENRNPI